MHNKLNPKIQKCQVENIKRSFNQNKEIKDMSLTIFPFSEYLLFNTC